MGESSTEEGRSELSRKRGEGLDGQRWKARTLEVTAAVAGSRQGALEGQGWRSRVTGERPQGKGADPVEVLHSRGY